MTSIRRMCVTAALAALIISQKCPIFADEKPSAFQSLDINKDGALTGTEMSGLESFDANNDMLISLEEYDAAKPSGPTLEQVEAKFKERDGNNDGWLSGTEIRGIESFDADINGRVTREEFGAGLLTMDPDSSNEPAINNNPLASESSLYRVVAKPQSKITSYQGPDKNVTEEVVYYGEVVKVTKVADSFLWVERTLPDTQLAVGWVSKDDLVDAEQGETLLRDALRETKEPRFYESLAILCEADDRLDEAIELLTTAINAAPRDYHSAGLYVQRSMLWQDKNERSKAFADICDAMNLQRDTDSLLVRAVLWAHRNDEAKAIRDLNDVISAEPNNPLSYAYRANVYSMFGHNDEAVADYSRAIDLRPFHSEFYNARSGHILRKGEQATAEEIDAALADSSLSIELDPTNAGAWMRRGLLWARKNDTAKTVADIEEAFRRVRPGRKTRELQFEMAQACFVGGLTEKGIALLQGAADKDQCPQAYFGLVYQQLGSAPKTALENAQAGVAGFHDEFGHEMLAIAYAANGDLESAKVAMNIAIFWATSEAERDRLRTTLQSFEPTAAAPRRPDTVSDGPAPAVVPQPADRLDREPVSGSQPLQLIPIAPAAPRP